MKFILAVVLSVVTISYALTAASYVDRNSPLFLVDDILTTSGSLHSYSGINLAPNTDLRGTDLSYSDLYVANLSGAVLSSANLTGANLSSANLTGANLSNANLSGADLSTDINNFYRFTSILVDADFSGADLRNADLTGADLTNADLSYADLTGADLTGADLSGVINGNIIGTPTIDNRYIMRNGYIIGPDVDLTGIDLSGANLGTSIQGPYFDLSGTNLNNADLSNANLRYARLSGANLQNADLTNTDFSYTTLSRVTSGNIIGSPTALPDGYVIRNGYILGSRVELINANLSGEDLTDIDLTYADLTGADLTGANLAGADLRYAEIYGADLTGADLTGVRTISDGIALDELLDNLRNKISLLEARIAQAVAGPRGEKGDKGDKGDTGDTGPPGPAGLDSEAIQTLKVSEPYVEVNEDGTFNVQYTVQSSDDLSNWTDADIIDATIKPENPDKQFLRIGVDGSLQNPNPVIPLPPITIEPIDTFEPEI